MTRTSPSAGWALITNDDGIAAPGLRALAVGAVAAGLDVVVAAPSQEASGAGSSIMSVRRDGVVPVEPHLLSGLDGVPTYGVAGQPAFISFAALNGWFDTPPSLVLSGINHGANLGRAVQHSGTVGAALTAGLLGVRALAVSLDCDHLPPGAEARWDTAAALLPMALDVLADTAPGTVLSLNVPNLSVGKLGDPRATPLAARGRWRPEVRAVDGGLRVHGVRRGGPLEPGSDAAPLAASPPTLTTLSPVAEDTRVRLAEMLAARGRL
ncbi:MAG: 5'/3'-nucleotidase SurE, partial [Pseudonocardia sp.]